MCVWRWEGKVCVNMWGKWRGNMSVKHSNLAEKTFASFAVLWLFTKFFCEILGRGILRCGKSKQSTNVFCTKIVFFTYSRKFSSSKVFHYTVSHSSGRFTGAAVVTALPAMLYTKPRGMIIAHCVKIFHKNVQSWNRRTGSTNAPEFTVLKFQQYTTHNTTTSFYESKLAQ